MPALVHALIDIEQVKTELNIPLDVETYDKRLSELALTATRQIEAHINRSLTKQARVELFHTKKNTRGALDLFGSSPTGMTRLIREQIFPLTGFPVDFSADFKVFYDPDRQFDAIDQLDNIGGTDPKQDGFDFDVITDDRDISRLILKISTARFLNALKVEYTAGFDFASPTVVDPLTTWDTNNLDADGTLSNDDLTVDQTDIGGVLSVHGVSSGKYFFEYEINTAQGFVGVAQSGIDVSTDMSASAVGWFIDPADGNKLNNGTSVAYGSAFGTDAKIGVALDMDNGAVWFSVNGVWQGGATQTEIETGDTTNAAFTGLTGLVHAAVGNDAANPMKVTANFGQVPFFTPVPKGFVDAFGAAFTSGSNVVLKDVPIDLRRACLLQTLNLYKKMKTENINFETSGGDANNSQRFLTSRGLTPEAASLLAPYRKVLTGRF